MNIHEGAQRTGKTVLRALDTAGQVEKKFFLGIGTGIDKGAKEIKKKYVPVALAIFLTFATVAGAACDRDSNPTKIPDSNTPTAGQVVPENKATMEEAARVEEVSKIIDMLDGHNLAPYLQDDLDNYLSDVANPSYVTQSEYDSIVKRSTDPVTGKIEYTVHYDHGKAYLFSAHLVKSFMVSSVPSFLPGSNSTYEQLEITFVAPLPANADIIENQGRNASLWNIPKNADTYTLQNQLKADLVKYFPAEMKKPHTEFMGTTLKLPHVEEYTNHGADETVPGTYSLTVSLISGGHPIPVEEKLEHWYARDKAVAQIETPVGVINPLFAKLEQALGEKWIDISYTAGHILNDRLNPGFNYPLPKPLTGLEGDFCIRAYNSLDFDAHAGFSLSPIDFIPNLEVDYVQGKDYFTRMYGIIFTPDQVNNLYNFVKEDIFEGKEY